MINGLVEKFAKIFNFTFLPKLDHSRYGSLPDSFFLEMTTMVLLLIHLGYFLLFEAEKEEGYVF